MTAAENGPPAAEVPTSSESQAGSGVFEDSPFTQILEAVPFGLFVIDAAGAPVYSNSRADEILKKRLSPDATPDTLAESYSAYLAGTDSLYPADRMPIIRALAGEKSTVSDMEIRRGDSVTYLEVSGAPVLDANHRVKYAVAVFHDITAARLVEAALQHLADQLAARASERAEELESMKHVLADTVESTIPGEGTPTRSTEGDAHIDPCGECWAYKDFEQARESAALAKQALTLFIANFSHELRTPLNHIIGFSDLIDGKIQRGVTHGIDKHTEDIRQSGASLLDTLEKIITMAEAESSDLKLSLEILEVAPILHGVAAKFTPFAERNGNRLEMVISGELGLVQTDTARLRAALEQIVENACKHCRNGFVAIAVSRKGDGTDGSIEVVVSDTGRGIDPKRAASLVRGEVVPGDPLREGGLGVGIPLAVHSLKALGGSLSFTTESGAGSRFVLTFPTYTRL